MAFLFSCQHKAKVVENSYSGIGVESVKPEDLKQYAPQPLPSETARRLNLMLDLVTPASGKLHPSNNKLFFTWRVTGTSQVWRLDKPNGFPVQMTAGKDSTQILDITADGKFLILSRDVDGQENPGLYLQSVEGGPLTKLFHKPKVRASFQFMSKDSKTLYFTANDEKPEDFIIYKMNIDTKAVEVVFNQPGLWSIMDYNESEFILSKFTGSRSNEVFLYNLRSKDLKPILGQKQKELFDVKFSAIKNEFIIRTSAYGNFSHLFRYNIQGKLIPLTENLTFDVEDFSMDDKKTKIVYEVNENGYYKIFVLNANTYKAISLPVFKGSEFTNFIGFSKDSSKMVISVGDSKSPRRSFVYDLLSKKATQWITPSVPEVDLTKFISPTLEYYKSRDGEQIPFFVRRPKQCINKTCPVIAYYHGGPEGQSLPGFNTFAQLFIDQGFIFAEPNVRGSTGYGKAWLDSDNGPRRLQVIHDIEDFSIFVKKNWSYNGEKVKVGAVGWSYGGYSTLMAMTRFAGAYDAGAALVGMSNLLSFLNNTAPYRRHLRTSEYGDPDKDKEALIQLSPITYIDKIQGPLLIVQGANDPRVPAGEAIQIQKLLQAKKLKSQLILFADEGHGTQKKENRILEWGHVLKFFEENLK